jgi:hypothetical protein
LGSEFCEENLCKLGGVGGGRKEELDGKSSWREKLQFVVADITVLHRSFLLLLIFFSFFCVVVVVCGLFAGHLDLVEFGAPVREIAGWVLGIDDISASMSLTSISFLIISSRLAQSPSSSGCYEIDEVGFFSSPPPSTTTFAAAIAALLSFLFLPCTCTDLAHKPGFKDTQSQIPADSSTHPIPDS